MDRINTHSEIIESLDFLRPPVKRISNKTRKDTNINTNSVIQIHRSEIRELHKCISKCNTYLKAKPPEVSSTSVFERKSLRTQILGNYSIVSYTTLLHPSYREDRLKTYSNEDKPVIKITVIPKAQQTQTGRLHRKSRNNPTRIHRTVSNHDSSVRTKKLFVIVTRENEKPYEIKPSESARLTFGQIESKFIDVDNIAKSVTNINKYFDMNKNKGIRKNNKINTKHNFELDDIAESSSLFKRCECKEYSGNDFNRNTNARPSRVRITGRVGLSEDEKYILNCTATVDNKPITADISKHIGDGSSHLFFQYNDGQPIYREQFETRNFVAPCKMQEFNKNYKNKNGKDSNIQVDFENFNSNNEHFIENDFKSKKSQSTQVNFNLQLPNIDALRSKGRNETIQCNCYHLDKVISTPGDDTEENTLRAHHSPLVIISVYPKQDTYETAKIQNKPILEDCRRPRRFGKDVANANANQPDKRQVNYIGSNRGTPRASRSPSPLQNCCVQRSKNNSQFEKRSIDPTRRRESPKRTNNTINKSLTKMPKNKGEKCREQIDFNKINTCTIQNQNSIKTREPKNVRERLKKTLIEDYTKILTGNKNRNYNTNDSKNINSRVNIKIDGDSGKNYDLLFAPGKLKNDLRIRTTVKETGTQKYEDYCRRARNNSYSSTRKSSPVKQIYHSKGVLDFPNRTSTLNPRDSIEIFHRRETSHRIKDSKANESDRNGNYDKSFAHMKHYTGDNCELPNPVERDKQIRELLGIINRTPTSKQESKVRSVSEELNTVQYVYKKTCNNDFESGVSQYNLYPCCCMSKEKDKKDYSGKYNETEYPQNGTGMDPSTEETSLYGQVILNRNVQIFLQLEQFSKQKPIVLTRKQYNKVKRTIQETIKGRTVGQNRLKNSIISIGEIRKRTIANNGRVEFKLAKYTQTKKSVTMSNDGSRDDREKESSHRECFKQSQVQTIVLFDSKKVGHSDTGNNAMGSELRTVSSLQIHYTNIGYTKSDRFSSTHVGSLSSTSFNQRNNSLHTIFKGQRKTPTPNLGTSVFTLLSNSTKLKSKYYENSSSTPDVKAKKPFLRRLMSCLVMQSRMSDKKIPVKSAPRTPSVNSSLDSYHINTSLGAIEMTSSVYDTSASFYSDHAIRPIVNNKMKRGFFSSVRGFLTSR